MLQLQRSKARFGGTLKPPFYTMTITQYKLALLEIVKSKKDIYRVKCLYKKSTDFYLYRYYGKHLKEIQKEEVEQSWKVLRVKLIEQEQFAFNEKRRMERINNFVDYSHLAYNNVADDF